MANRKQRRRREKEKRHAYEIVEIDSEGNETVLDSAELRPEPSRNGKGRGKKKSSSASPRSRGAQQSRSRRSPVQEPSWNRVIKRGFMFAPIFFAVVYLLGGQGMTTTGLIVQTLLLLAVFIPFSYFMDRLMWRSFQRRSAKARDSAK